MRHDSVSLLLLLNRDSVLASSSQQGEHIRRSALGSPTNSDLFLNSSIN